MADWILRVRTVGIGWPGAPGLMTAYFERTSSPDAGDAQDVHDRVHAWLDSVKAVFENDTTWTVDPAVDILDEVTGSLLNQITVGTPSAAVVGTGTDGLAAAATMAVYALNTATFVSGRRVRGRWFVGPVNKGSVTGGLLASGAVTILNNAASDLTSVVNGPAVPVVWHRPVAGAGGLAAPITGFTARSKLGVLRSRRD